MGIALDMKKIADDIATSYDLRVKGLGELVKNSHDMLKGFQGEHKEMASNLRRSLEEGETDRLKSFKSMMAEIRKGIKEIETYVKKKLKEFSDAHAEMSGKLKNDLAKYVVGIFKETKRLMQNIEARQKARNEEVANLLETFKEEREKMATNWQALTATMAKKRGSKPAKVEAGVEVKTVEEVVRKPKKRGKKRGRKKKR